MTSRDGVRLVFFTHLGGIALRGRCHAGAIMFPVLSRYPRQWSFELIFRRRVGLSPTLRSLLQLPLLQRTHVRTRPFLQLLCITGTFTVFCLPAKFQRIPKLLHHVNSHHQFECVYGALTGTLLRSLSAAAPARASGTVGHLARNEELVHRERTACSLGLQVRG